MWTLDTVVPDTETHLLYDRNVVCTFQTITKVVFICEDYVAEQVS